MYKNLRKIGVLSATFATVGVLGLSGSASAMTIDNSGSNADNWINTNYRMDSWWSNSNWLGVLNSNDQYGQSGHATVHGNESTGGAGSGNASNSGNTGTSIMVENETPMMQGTGGSGGGSYVIDNSGNRANNTINANYRTTYTSVNQNNVGVWNNNAQQAGSGNASVRGNESGGSASTGSASNSQSTTTDVHVINAAGGTNGTMNANTGSEVTIDNSGNRANNEVNVNHVSRTEVTNTNNVGVVNSNNQQAQSGNASVRGNESGGSASTGGASNTSMTRTETHVTNG